MKRTGEPKLCALFGLELVIARDSRAAVPAHAHEGYCFGVVTAGSRLAGPPDAPLQADRGRIVAASPGEVHVSLPDGQTGCGYRMFRAGRDLLEPILADAGFPGPYPARLKAPVIDDDVLAADMLTLHRDLTGDDAPAADLLALHRDLTGDDAPAADLLALHRDLTRDYAAKCGVDAGEAPRGPRIGQLEAQSRFAELAAALFTRHGAAGTSTQDRETQPPGRAVQAAAKARDYLRAHAREDISLDDLATAANLSAFHLCRVFKRRFGLPPHAYLTQVRLGLARAMLRGGAPLADTALACGFYDQSHFTTAFRKYTGMSPGGFVKAIGR